MVIRRLPLARAVLAVALLGLSPVAHATSLGLPSPAAHCDARDRPETGMPGQVPLADQLSGRSRRGYSCNLRLVGGTTLDGLGGDAQMTWYGSCAYRVVPGANNESDGVGVVDVADPAHPQLVRVLRERVWNGKGGLLGIHEGIHANAARGILVVPIASMISVYDLTGGCTNPRHVTDYDFGYPSGLFKQPSTQGMGVHSGQITPDGNFYLGTDIGNGGASPTGPCLTVIDLSVLTAPRLVTRWGHNFPCHDLGFNTDGSRAYVGFYDAYVGYAAAEVGAFAPANAASQLVSGLRIVDTSMLVPGVTNPDLRIVGQLTGARQHTETFTRIGGRDYVVAAEEGFCPGGNGRIVDVTDERHPVAVSEITLAVNQAPGCAAAEVDSDVGKNLLLYMSHYLSVDDPADAHLAFFSWYSSGLRVFDISHPRHPREVAYFNPAVGSGSDRTHDSTSPYPRYVPATGQVWLGSAVNAFEVVELEPSLRPQVHARWSATARANRSVVAGVARVQGGSLEFCAL